ncbi:MAG: hypothetical protein ACUVQG_11815 [Thermogutta sp.]
MSRVGPPQDFDPYHAWLGISPQERPITLYRLLGLSQFESNEVVIESAAEQRLAFLRTKTLGPHAMAAESLIREITRARLVLLDPAKKRAYDAQLSVNLGSECPTEVGSVRPELEEVSTSAPVSFGDTQAGRLFAASRRRNQKYQSYLFATAVAVLGILVLVTALIFVRKHPGPVTGSPSNPPDREEVAAKSIGETGSDANGSASSNAGTLSQSRTQQDLNPLSGPMDETQEAESAPSLPGDRPEEIPSLAAGHGVPAEADKSETAKGQQAALSGQVKQSAQADSESEASRPLAKPPDAAIAKQILASLIDTFDLEKTGSREEIQVKLNKLQEAAKDPSISSDQRFVLLHLIGRVALQAGEMNTLWQSWAELINGYLCDGGTVLKEMFVTARGDSYWVTRATVALSAIIPQMISQGRLRQVDAAVDALTEMARSTRPNRAATALLCLTQARSLIGLGLKWQEDDEAAKHRVAATPEDGAAHRALGRWLCLGADDWESGLVHLSACDDSNLAELAQAEQTMDRDKPASLVAVADRWWQYAAKADLSERTFFRAHALRLYERALLPSPEPLSVLEKNRIAKLMSQPESRSASSFPNQIAAALRGGPSLVGKWIDLSPLVRVEMAPRRGEEIRIERGGLILGQRSGIFMPFRTSGDYDLKVAVTRLEGDDGFGVIIPVNVRECVIFVDGYNRRYNGIQLIDGKWGNDPANPSRRTAIKLRNAVNLMLEVSVRVREPLAAIEASLNGVPITAYQGRITSLTLEPHWAVANQVGVMTWANPGVVVHSISVRPLDDQAVLMFGD